MLYRGIEHCKISFIHLFNHMNLENANSGANIQKIAYLQANNTPLCAAIFIEKIWC